MRKKVLIYIGLLGIAFLLSNLLVAKILTINRVVLSNTTALTIERIIHGDSVFKRWCIKNSYSFDENIVSKNGYVFNFSKAHSTSIPIQITGVLNILSTLKITAINEKKSELNWNTQLISSNFFTRIFTYFKAQQLSKQLDIFLQHIKSFAENTNDLYGFAINIKKQTEPIVSFYTKSVVSSFKYEGIKESYLTIKHFVEENELASTNTAILLNINKIKDDSTTIMIGIPTEKKLVQGKFSTMQMPPEGNMLIAEYKGMYKNRDVIYRAMENFIQDNSLSKASLPYEKFSTGVLPIDDTSTVHFVMCFPIF